MTLLAVLVPCLFSRPWQKVVRELERQQKPFGNKVSIVHLVDDGEMTSGQKRQVMCQMEEVKSATYRTFVDDDDMVSPDYISSLIDGCETGRDVISLDLEFTNIKKLKRERWHFGMYPNDRRTGRMCVNHLCAWKTHIADQVAWCPKLGYGDDHLWFQPLYHAGLIRSHFHIPRVLYQYIYNPTVTVNQTHDRINNARAYVGKGLGCYRTASGEILVQDGHNDTMDQIDLRDRCNNVVRFPLTQQLKSQHYHNITIA